MTRAAEDALLHATYCRGDRHMLRLLTLHMAAAVWFGSFYETWLETWLVGGLALAMFVVARQLQPGTLLTRCVAGVSLQAFVALHIYQLHGLAEMHFFFFTAFAAMQVYQDWRCMWPGALLIIAQHIWFAILHNQGVDMLFFEGDYIGVTKLGFHFGIAVFHVALCNLGAQLLRKQTLADLAVRAELTSLRQTAERASAAKTMFLGDMSHELRTPMTGVLGTTEALLQSPDLSPDHRECLEIVRTSALAVVDIVNDSLDLARVEAGRLDLADEPLDLRRLAEEVVELLTPRAVEHGVELVARWEPGGPARVRGDAGRWRQVLVNLTGNAIKFASGGHVLVDVAVRPARAGERTEIVVRIDDSGRGIAPDVLPRLFQRFEQGGAGTYAHHGGSGLGLAISRQLVVRMGGELSVHSVLGAGATFVVRVPATVEAPAEPPPCFRGRVLLAGRADLTLGVIAEQLEEMGAHVHVVHGAAAGQAALAAAAAQGRPFQLLFAEPATLAPWRELPPELRVVALGARAGEPANGARDGGERIVWLSRHGELRRIASGAARGGAAARSDLPQLGLSILLVEDDAVCAKVTTRILRMFGCSVAHAADGEAAVAACRAHRYDVVLMDCRMPRMDGYEATRRVRAGEAGGSRTTIVALSANSLPADREQCLRAGADVFLAKPVQVQALLGVLEGVAKRRECTVR